MNFGLSDDQSALRDAVAGMLAAECPPSVLRAVWESDSGMDASLWRALAEMGVFGLLVGSDAGGLGMGMIEAVVVAEELGRVCAPGPVIEHAVAAIPIVAADGSLVGRWLESLLDGSAVASFGPVGDALRGESGTPWGADADLILLDRAGRLLAIAREDIKETAVLPVVDRSWREVKLTCVDGEAVADGEFLARAAWERGALAAAAELVGLGARMVEMAVDYVKERRQFGVPVGSYQAVKHHLADAHLAVEYARPAVYRAAYSIDHGEDTVARDVSFAKVSATRAADLAGRTALQCHGAIGYSYECDLHMWIKRSWALAAHWGTTDQHRRRVAAHVVGALERSG